jgi:hypothetical protein
MEFIQQNQNTLILVAGCCVALLVFGGIIGFVLQIFGFGFSIIANFIEFFFNILSGGPVAWCGCLVGLFACAGCGVLTLMVGSALQQCGTAQAVNLCRLFGY